MLFKPFVFSTVLIACFASSSEQFSDQDQENPPEVPAFMSSFDYATKEGIEQVITMQPILHLSRQELERQLSSLARLSSHQIDQLVDWRKRTTEWQTRQYEAEFAALSPNARLSLTLWLVFMVDRHGIERTSIEYEKDKRMAKEINDDLTTFEQLELASLTSGTSGMEGNLDDDSYLVGSLPPLERLRFRQIFRNRSLTLDEKYAAAQRLAAEDFNSDQITEWTQQNDRVMEGRRKMKETLADMSPNARHAAADLLLNMSAGSPLKVAEKRRKKEKLLQGLSVERDELKTLKDSCRAHFYKTIFESDNAISSSENDTLASSSEEN